MLLTKRTPLLWLAFDPITLSILEVPILSNSISQILFFAMGFLLFDHVRVNGGIALYCCYLTPFELLEMRFSYVYVL